MSVGHEKVAVDTQHVRAVSPDGPIQPGDRQPRRAEAALIIHDYIEGFREGVEEGYVFPAAVGGSDHGRSEKDLNFIRTGRGLARRQARAAPGLLRRQGVCPQSARWTTTG